MHRHPDFTGSAQNKKTFQVLNTARHRDAATSLRPPPPPHPPPRLRPVIHIKPFLRHTSEPDTLLMRAPQGSPSDFRMTPTLLNQAPLTWLLPSAQPVLPAKPPTRLADGTHRASSCLCAFAQAVPSARKVPSPLLPTLPLGCSSSVRSLRPSSTGSWPRSRCPPPDSAWHAPWVPQLPTDSVLSGGQ